MSSTASSPASQGLQPNASSHRSDRVTAAGLLITLGIIYGDIGTSPLYVLKAIAGRDPIDGAMLEPLILGAVSCVFWTLTLITTVKYVILTLKADNRGEGGIFSLLTLVRRHARWLVFPAVFGGAMLLADGIITPPISISSAVEGLQIYYPEINTIPIVISILVLLFAMQALGTSVVGTAFGPVMFCWFTMLLVLGVRWVMQYPQVLQAFNPYYAYNLLVHYPGGFWILGAVFLCTTGAEGIYSDMGHCGRRNIRLSWGYVKTCLVINYLGQGAYLIGRGGQALGDINPFYATMPEWFLPFGIGLATLAAIIASQALITGSFTLVSEAIRLSLWPRVKISYPSVQRGQIYLSSVNWMLLAGCIAIVLYFKESAHMEAAYGLAIIVTMINTTTLLCYYLYTRLWRRHRWAVYGFVAVFATVEGAFLVANLDKFSLGGWVPMLVGMVLVSLMLIWYSAARIKDRLTDTERLSDYVPILHELSRDNSIPKYATHLVFLTNASRPDEVESRVFYSILKKRPKRADIYWFVHVETMDDPYQMEYQVEKILENDLYKITFYLGFKVEPRINLFFRRVITDLVSRGEVDITSTFESLRNHNVIGDFRFVIFERFLSYENELPRFERFVLTTYFFIKGFTNADDKWFGLDTSSVKVEKVPLIIREPQGITLKRIYAPGQEPEEPPMPRRRQMAEGSEA